MTASASTSVHISDGSGSGLSCAKSAAAVTRSFTCLSISLSRFSSAMLPSRMRLRTWSIGSCSERMRETSSRLRYFAGSDME